MFWNPKTKDCHPTEPLRMQALDFSEKLTTGILASEQFVRGIHKLGPNTRIIYRPLSHERLFDPDGCGSLTGEVLAVFSTQVMLNFDDIHVK